MQKTLKDYKIIIKKNYPCIYCNSKEVVRVKKIPYLYKKIKKRIIINQKIIKVYETYARHNKLNNQIPLLCLKCGSYQLKIR